MEISREVTSLSDMAQCLSYVANLLETIEVGGGVPSGEQLDFLNRQIGAAQAGLAYLRNEAKARQNRAEADVTQVRKSPEDLYQRMEDILDRYTRERKLNLFVDAMWGDLDDMVWPDIGEEGVYQKPLNHCGHHHARPVLIEERTSFSDTEADSFDFMGQTWTLK